MKTLLGWLGDPCLHLVAIVAIVLTIGARSGSDPASAEAATTKCDLCRKYHDEARPCVKAVASGTPSVAIE